MFNIPNGLKIFVATTPMDMRKSFDGMAHLVINELKKDVYSGHVFVFCNKRGDKIKIFYWDRTGYCYWFKRLEQGIFRVPKVSGQSFCVTPAELSLILEGIELTHRQRHPSF